MLPFKFNNDTFLENYKTKELFLEHNLS